MATESKTATEEVKIDLFEDDDEFEEFEINEGTIYCYSFGKKNHPLIWTYSLLFTVYTCFSFMVGRCGLLA